jgi:hypothetical protein
MISRYLNKIIRHFWLKNRCWPNTFYYLTTPITDSNTDLQINNNNYQTLRSVVQEAFASVLQNSNRPTYSVQNSWTGWAYRLSFAILAWVGIASVSLAVYYAMVSLRDLNDGSVKKSREKTL